MLLINLKKNIFLVVGILSISNGKLLQKTELQRSSGLSLAPLEQTVENWRQRRWSARVFQSGQSSSEKMLCG